jgi:hypothetical protein
LKWHPHKGGACPVAPESMVRPRIRVLSRTDAEKREPTAAKGWRWSHNGTCGDIEEYQHFGEAA